jgi:hypothetical protein
MIEPNSQAAAETLARGADLGPLEGIEEMAGGGNNRLFRMVFESQAIVLKYYFKDAQDPRDRLDQEFSFLQFANNHAINTVPQAIAQDPNAGIALYTLLPGGVMTANDVTDNVVAQARAFVSALNIWRTEKDAQDLSLGSESCFSFDDHITTVNRRMDRLSGIGNDGENDAQIIRDARQFVDDELIPVWQALAQKTTDGARQQGIDLSHPISSGERCLSPSDFGFHNALLDQDGTVRFVDFEYAGWDDPAKLVGDFFNQVAVPIPPSYLSDFSDTVAALTPDAGATKSRIDLLLPVYGCKWICIILSNFLPLGSRRRQFAAAISANETAQRQIEQLFKARQKLGMIRTILGV